MLKINLVDQTFLTILSEYIGYAANQHFFETTFYKFNNYPENIVSISFFVISII